MSVYIVSFFSRCSIPAIVTTTAAVVGFVQLEMYKFHATDIKEQVRGPKPWNGGRIVSFFSFFFCSFFFFVVMACISFFPFLLFYYYYFLTIRKLICIATRLWIWRCRCSAKWSRCSRRHWPTSEEVRFFHFLLLPFGVEWNKFFIIIYIISSSSFWFV
jgi:hypothetical protein